ncbi:MAG: hypothetical protein KGH60_04915 [Candidatus Micrarchaeota archaeon]|nr:hypothetical protein [Candidatus Micrarchaeota archaeon]
MANKLLTINLRKYLSQQPRTKRNSRAIRYVRDRVAHYTKVKTDDVVISAELNSVIFKHYAKSMVPLKMNVSIENGRATATPFVVQKKQEAPKAQEKKAEAKKEERPAADAKKAAKAEKPKAAPAPKVEAKK